MCHHTTHLLFAMENDGSVALARRRRAPKNQCLVIPHMLVFSDRDWESRKQVITIFNPYAYDLHYNLKTTMPTRYNVPRSKGILGAGTSVDIPIHVPGEITEEVRDKFLIEVSGADGKGKRIIRAKVTPYDAPKRGRLFVLPLIFGLLVVLVLGMALGDGQAKLWLGFFLGVATMFLVSRLS